MAIAKGPSVAVSVGSTIITVRIAITVLVRANIGLVASSSGVLDMKTVAKEVVAVEIFESDGLFAALAVVSCVDIHVDNRILVLRNGDSDEESEDNEDGLHIR